MILLDLWELYNHCKRSRWFYGKESIHAFHFESGIAENLENKQYGFSETLVDWFAIQSPKIFKVFQELGIL